MKHDEAAAPRYVERMNFGAPCLSQQGEEGRTSRIVAFYQEIEAVRAGHSLFVDRKNNCFSIVKGSR